jgi:hypothetical protein
VRSATNPVSDPGILVKKGNPVSEREPVTLLNPVRKKDPFPDGVCDKPFSVVSLNEHIFLIPSAPYANKSRKGFYLKLKSQIQYSTARLRFNKPEGTKVFAKS